jgi:hypothetical protein
MPVIKYRSAHRAIAQPMGVKAKRQQREDYQRGTHPVKHL